MDKRTGKDEYPDLDLDELDRQIRWLVEPYPFIEAVLLHKGATTRYYLIFRVGEIQKEQAELYDDFYEIIEGPVAFAPLQLDKVHLWQNPEPFGSTGYYDWPFREWSWSIAGLEGNTVLPDEPVVLFEREGKNNLSVEVADTPVVSEERSNVGDENSFALMGQFWRIRYEKKEAHVKDLVGMQYLAFLLERPGTSIKARELYCAVSGRGLGGIMSNSVAIAQELNTDIGHQTIVDGNAKKAYLKRYTELQEDLEQAKKTGNIDEAEKIEVDMDKLLAELKTTNFTDPDAKKALDAVGQCLRRAYSAIEKAGMKDLAGHFRQCVASGGFYDFIYTGDQAWNIQ